MYFTIESSFLNALNKPVDNRSQEECDIIYENLKKLSTLSTFKDTTIRCITKFIKYETTKKDDYLYRTGDLITCWFIVLNGSIMVGNDKIDSLSKFGRKTHYQTHRIVDCKVLEDSEILVINYQEETCPKSFASFANALEKYSNNISSDNMQKNNPKISIENVQLGNNAEENSKENNLNTPEATLEDSEHMPKRIKLESDLSDNQKNCSIENENKNNQETNCEKMQTPTSSPNLDTSIEVIVLSDDSNEPISINKIGHNSTFYSLNSQNSDGNSNEKRAESESGSDIIFVNDESNDSKISKNSYEICTDAQNYFDNQSSCHSLSPPQSNDSHDVIELYSINKIMSVYENEKNISDDKEVLERWRIKKLSNSNVNLSCSNYKMRLKGDIRPQKQRVFKPNIFFEELIAESNLSDEEKKALDEKALNEKLASLAVREKKLKKSYEINYRRRFQNVKQVYLQGAYLLQNNTMMDKNSKTQTFAVIESNYKQQTSKLISERKEFLEQAATYAKSEEKALRDLFLSGDYVKGKFSEYFTIEVYQPQATRRNYVDDGCRCMLLPKNRIKNILIEDAIYEYYYGKPN